MALASSEVTASCRRDVGGVGCSGRHLAGKADPAGGWRSRRSERRLNVKAQSPVAGVGAEPGRVAQEGRRGR